MMGRYSREDLANCMDEIRAYCSSPVLDAVPWMNLKHPIHSVQEELIRPVSPQERAVAEPPVWALIRAAAGGLYAFRVMVELIRVRLVFRSQLRELRTRSYEIIAKSWHFGKKDSNGRDFYYGDLQTRLRERGVRMLLLTGDAQGALWDWTSDFQETALSLDRLPEWTLVPLTAPWEAVRLQWKSWRDLRRLANQTSRPLLRRLALRASRDMLSYRLIPTLLYAWVGKTSTRLWKPRVWLTLYEGHGWEQILWRGVREADPACKIAGYQHTILPPYLSALLRPSRDPGSRLRPDWVLCLGSRAKRLLEASHPDSVLTVFGTFRRQGPGSKSPVAPDPLNRTVIVLPEGLPDEARLLFEAALCAARKSPSLRFILRCHPQLPFGKVLPFLSTDPGSLPNVEVSQGSPIEQDFARSSAILYRGSSSVLYAVLAGLKPIYLDQEGLRDIDPLGELNVWRERIRDWAEMEPHLNRFERSDH